jgi:hypothetical protein
MSLQRSCLVARCRIPKPSNTPSFATIRYMDQHPRRYEPKLDAEGKYVAVAIDGDEVPFDVQDQRICDFLSWASQNAAWLTGGKRRIPRGDYFASSTRVIELCKHRGLMLFVEGSTNDHLLVRGGTAVDLGRKSVRNFQELRIARAVPSAAKHVFPAGIQDWPSGVFVTDAVVGQLNKSISDEGSDARCLSSLPVNRTFVYVDVSDFSQHPPAQQTLVINSLLSITREKRYWTAKPKRGLDSIEASLCIGDGYIFVLKSALHGTLFAAYLAQLIEILSAQGRLQMEFHFRVGVHTGLVYRFWDWGRGRNGDWNYIGDGINGGQRVLSAVGKDTDDVVFVSADVRRSIQAEPKEPMRDLILAALQNRGRRKDKHGGFQRVYEVNHTEIANPMLPDWFSDELLEEDPDE